MPVFVGAIIPKKECNVAKTAIITGTSSGLGSAAARRLAKDGFSIAVNHSGKRGPAEKLVAQNCSVLLARFRFASASGYNFTVIFVIIILACRMRSGNNAT